MNATHERRVLLLGATGTLGNTLASALSRNFIVVAPTPLRSAIVHESPAVTWLTTRLDAMKLEGLDRLIVESKATAIINCIAALPRLGAPCDEATCVAVNATLIDWRKWPVNTAFGSFMSAPMECSPEDEETT